MSKSTVVSCRFVEAEPEKIPVTPEAQFRSDMMKEYWHEAMEAGMDREEAAEYATAMVS